MSDLVGTVAQVAERLEADEAFVRELIRDHRIPFVRLGPRKVVVPWKALEEWLLGEAYQSIHSEPALGLVADGSPSG